MGIIKDITGQKFNKLTVLKAVGKDKHNKVLWLCRCDCGQEITTTGNQLKSNKTKSCHCLRDRDISGQVFGRLTALEVVGRSKEGSKLWRCICECGNEKEVALSILSKRKGGTKSCGCLANEARKRTAHQVLKTHGLSHTPTWKCWKSMKGRCLNSNNKAWKNYGGRGIQVCDRWLNSFEAFLEDMGERPSPDHSIDRINVDGGYEPSNCRWATDAEQRRNRRDSVLITFNRKTQCAKDWAMEIGISPQALERRLKKWTVEEALTKPKPIRYPKVS